MFSRIFPSKLEDAKRCREESRNPLKPHGEKSYRDSLTMSMADGRVVATGRRFREADEHAAVQHFRELSPGPPLRFHPRQSRRCRRKPGGDGHPGSDADSGFGG